MTRKAQVGVAFGVLALSGGLWLAAYHKTAEAPASTQQLGGKQPAKKAQLDRLQIEAMRSRKYEPSQITTAQSLGNAGGYTREIISFNSDGLKEYALLAKPTSAPPSGGYPVVILAHGYVPPTQYQTAGNDYVDYVAAWAKAGFVVIKPDYRGNGRSEGTPEGGHFSPVYAYDVLNLVASLKQYPVVNADRVGLFGHSMGGHEVLRAAVVNKDIKATAIAAGVVGSFYDFIYNWPHSPMPNDQPTSVTRSIRQQALDAHGDPKANPGFWDSASALNFVDAISGPVQVHHDSGDSTVPVVFSDHLVEKLKAAHKSVEYFQYPGDNHQFSGNAHTQLIQRTADFFKKNL